MILKYLWLCMILVILHHPISVSSQLPDLVITEVNCNSGRCAPEACECLGGYIIRISGTGYRANWISTTISHVEVLSPLGTTHNLRILNSGWETSQDRWWLSTTLPLVPWYETQDQTSLNSKFKVRIKERGSTVWSDYFAGLRYRKMDIGVTALFRYSCTGNCSRAGDLLTVWGMNLPYRYMEPPMVMVGKTSGRHYYMRATNSYQDNDRLELMLPTVDKSELFTVYPLVGGTPYTVGGSIPILYANLTVSSSSSSSSTGRAIRSSSSSARPTPVRPAPMIQMIVGCSDFAGPSQSGTGNCQGSEIITIMGAYFCDDAEVELRTSKSSRVYTCDDYTLHDGYQSTCRLPKPSDSMRGTTVWVTMECIYGKSTVTSEEFAGISFAAAAAQEPASSSSSNDMMVIVGCSVGGTLLVVFVAAVIGYRYMSSAQRSVSLLHAEMQSVRPDSYMPM